MKRPTAANGINLTTSEKNPDSSLVKMLKFLREKPHPISKRGIMEQAFNKTIRPASDRWGSGVEVSGWRGQFFSVIKKNGYIGTLRYGRVTYYFISDKGKYLLEQLGV